MAQFRQQSGQRMAELIAAEITLLVTSTLEEIGVPYVIGGSLASITHGVIRNTQDADIVADILPDQISRFTNALKADFYIDPLSIMDAILHRSSFNLIHFGTAFKVDVFLPKDRAFARMQMERRSRRILQDEPERTAWVTSAEDIILAKLEWFRLGGEVSERQWRDVLGVMKTQGARLDKAYLRHWAAELEVSDLLERAFSEVSKNETK